MTHHIASVLASISIASVFMSTAAIPQTAKDIEGAWTLFLPMTYVQTVQESRCIGLSQQDC